MKWSETLRATEARWRISCASGRFRRESPTDEGDGGSSGGDIATERKTRTKSKTAKPPLYKVILLNDDYTPMEFVVEVLKAVFHKQHAEATRIMLHVHQNGIGVAGVYPFEVAETKTRHRRGTGARGRVSAQVRDGKGVTGR